MNNHIYHKNDISVTLNGVNCNFKDSSFTLSLDTWDKFKQMHPVRTKEAFFDMLSILSYEEEINADSANKMIMEEYKLHSNIMDVNEKAISLHKKGNC